jgi:hypothetical protein
MTKGHFTLNLSICNLFDFKFLDNTQNYYDKVSISYDISSFLNAHLQITIEPKKNSHKPNQI